jgi:hypothetical protein
LITFLSQPQPEFFPAKFTLGAPLQPRECLACILPPSSFSGALPGPWNKLLVPGFSPVAECYVNPLDVAVNFFFVNFFSKFFFL